MPKSFVFDPDVHPEVAGTGKGKLTLLTVIANPVVLGFDVSFQRGEVGHGIITLRAGEGFPLVFSPGVFLQEILLRG